MAFTRNASGETHLVFFKRGDLKVPYLDFEDGESLGRKVHFFQLPKEKRNFKNLKLCVNIHVVPLVNFPAQLNYASTLNAREVMKFYNLGGQSFETDFKI